MDNTPAPPSTSCSTKMGNDSQVFKAPIGTDRDIISDSNKAKYDLASRKNFSKKSRRPFKRAEPCSLPNLQSSMLRWSATIALMVGREMDRLQVTGTTLRERTIGNWETYLSGYLEKVAISGIDAFPVTTARSPATVVIGVGGSRRQSCTLHLRFCEQACAVSQTFSNLCGHCVSITSMMTTPENMSKMRKTPRTSETCFEEMLPTAIESKEDNFDQRDLSNNNSNDDHCNQPELVFLSAQSAASEQFFSTPELLEMALLPLPPRDIVSVSRISIQAKKTINGSIRLQRHNPLDHFVAPFSSGAEYAELCYPPHDGPLLRANPFLFNSPRDLSSTGLLPLTGLVDDLINTNDEPRPSLGLMLISQPPIRRVKLELCCVPVCHYYEVVLKEWELVMDEGIRVQDLVEFGRKKIPKRGREGGWLVEVQLRDGYEAVEEV
ncbi:hypothetical protein TI39_contig4111g00015 [Zymoseptoria brevis]|uniref:Uncharacterized protein n=1 Tax=Zymoseptoria brevis TaxID=1047168 RepID=A0A0F4GDI5_9PEZI|nr:hypothetical protein TI39_contig4111g00015 [Zymoseptoria brevis]